VNFLAPNTIPRDVGLLCALVLPALCCLIYLGILSIPVDIHALTLPLPLHVLPLSPVIALCLIAIIPSFIWGCCLGYVLQLVLVKPSTFPWQALLSLVILAASIWYGIQLYQKFHITKGSDLETSSTHLTPVPPL
jgi:hypothetical protein